MTSRSVCYGLTGGIACGKSTIGGFLSDLGYEVINADDIGRALTQKGEKGWKQIKAQFPKAIFEPDGTINRQKLSDLVFSNAQQKKALESILHPLILEKMHQAISRSANALIFVEAALIFEGHYEDQFDGVIIVKCTSRQQIERLCAQRGFSLEKAMRMINAQIPLVEKEKRATYVIDNSKDLPHARMEVKKLLEKLHEI